MIELQFVQQVPSWACKRGLDDTSFNLLEQIALDPEREEDLLRSVDYGTRCCIQQALEFGRNKGLIIS